MRRWRWCRPAVLLLTLLNACGRGDAKPERVKVRIGVRPHMTVAPVYLARDLGLYDSLGLDVELVALESVASSLPMLLQGQLDVLPGPVSPGMFNAIHRGARLRIVGDKGRFLQDDCPPNSLVKSPAFVRRGGTPRRVGTMKEPFNQMFVERALESRGVSPDSVKYLYMPKAAEFDAILSGDLDVASLGDPWRARAVAKGAEAWVGQDEVLPGAQYSVYLYGPRLLDREPEVGERLALAHLRAMAVHNEGRTERNLATVGKVLGFDVSELRTMCWPRMPEGGEIDTTSLQEFQRWAMARGDVDAVVAPAMYWDGRFVAAARRALAPAP